MRFRPLADEGDFELAKSVDLFDLERNAEVDPAMFNFVVPPGVDVLEGY